MRLTSSIAVLILLLAASAVSAGDLEDYRTLDKLYTEGRFDEATNAAQHFISNYPESRFLPNVIYIAGRLSTDVAGALDRFSKIVVKYPASDVADNALFMLAQYHYANGTYDKAITRFRYVAERCPGSDVADAATWWISQSYNAMGDAVSARNWASKLVQKFPDSKYAKLVDVKPPGAAPSKPGSFAIQVGSFLGNDTAAALKDKLVKKGYGAYIVRNEVAGKALFRVRVGNFGSKEEAAQRALTLKSVEGIEGWVTAVTD